MDAGANSDWLCLVERHRQRREQDIPTVTVLGGDRRVAARLWLSAPAAFGLSSVVARSSDPAAVVAHWLGSDEVKASLRASVLNLMATDSGISTGELACRLAGRTVRQLEQLAENVAAAHRVALPTVRGALGLAAEHLDTSPQAAKLAERLLGRLPPLLVDPEQGSMDSLCRAAATVVDLAEAMPRTEIGLILGAAPFDALRARVSDRVGTILKEGLILLRERSDGPREGPSTGTSLEYDGQEFARSRAEWRLFETLNGRSRTAGLFKLNQKIAVPEVAPPLEIDLLSDALRLAVEVDGYHHFRDAQAYRRDRRKDVHLQHLGYVVVRVLASDVENELQHVLDIIDATVERCRRSEE